MVLQTSCTEFHTESKEEEIYEPDFIAIRKWMEDSLWIEIAMNEWEEKLNWNSLRRLVYLL